MKFVTTHLSASNSPYRILHFAVLVLSIPVSLLLGMASAAESFEQPNIIIVMPDDMGYGDLAVTGNPVIRTPNLDRFASESATLTNFHVSPVCSPTRACLMTGRYNHRTRVIDTFKGRSMMEPEEMTIAEMLGKAGYATGIFGKWHLGDNYPLRPQDQGFDEVLVHRGGGLAQPSEPIENNSRYTDPILFHNGNQVQTKGYCTDVYFDSAIEFMKQKREAKQPFFVYLTPNAPHGPYHDVPEDLLAYYKSVDLTPALNGNTSDKHRDTVARVFAMVENIDQNMGRLDHFLESSNLGKNTLVLFFTDNGPNTPRYVGHFREMKSHVHSGGVRTMFYARWPQRIEAGTSSDRLAAHIDVLPTVLEAAGLQPPSGVELDGVSLLQQLVKKNSTWEDRPLVLQAHRGNQPVEFHHFTVRTQDWKLIRSTGFQNETIQSDKPFELYRADDLAEANNLADEHSQKRDELKAAYQDWLADVSSTREDNYAPPRIIIGSPYEPRTDLSIQDWRVDQTEGWGQGGTWKVEIVDSGPYDASVRWESPIGEREAVLHVGDKSFQAKLSAAATEVRFDDVQLPKGNADVRVELSGQGKNATPRFVTIERPHIKFSGTTVEELQHAVDDAPPRSVIECVSDQPLVVTETLHIRSPITLDGLTAKLPDGLGNTDMILVVADDVTLRNLNLHGNYDSVSQQDRAPLVHIRASRFLVERCRFHDASKEGVAIDPPDDRDIVGGEVRYIEAHRLGRDAVSLSGGDHGHRVRDVNIEHVSLRTGYLRGAVEVSDGTDNITVAHVFAEDSLYAVDVQDHGKPAQINTRVAVKDVTAIDCRHIVRTQNRDFGHERLILQNLNGINCKQPLVISNTVDVLIEDVRINNYSGTEAPVRLKNCKDVVIKNVHVLGETLAKAPVDSVQCKNVRLEDVGMFPQEERGDGETQPTSSSKPPPLQRDYFFSMPRAWAVIDKRRRIELHAQSASAAALDYGQTLRLWLPGTGPDF